MKKLFISIGLLAVIILSALISFRFYEKKSIPESSQEVRVAYILEQNNCLSCHSQEAQLPFYGKLPIVKQMLEKHMKNGLRYIDLQKVKTNLEQGNVVSEVDLAKIEQSVINESMPIIEYKAIHWLSSFSNQEKNEMLQWVKQVRGQNYITGIASSEFENEPVQPIMDEISFNKEKAGLGFKLYHDTRLSADNTVSCATCHPLDKGGVDGTRTSKGIYGQWGGINAPTVYNAALNFVQFWDGRAKDLQVQAGGPPLDGLEMGSNWEQITGKIKADKEMVAAFATLYPEGITALTITDAIAEFEKTLLTPNSRFDLYLKGDKNSLTKEEIAGYELFKKKNCATCHVGVNMGGQSFEYMGVVADYYADRTEVAFHDKDLGHIGVTGDEKDRYKFKTPTLRNIDLTAPYLHDGTAKTLDDAVKAMFKYQMGKDYTNEEVESLVLFMKTLTGENNLMN